jgi:hypothetical protein
LYFIKLKALYYERSSIHFPFIFGTDYVKKFEISAIKKLPKDAFLHCLFDNKKRIP